MKATNHSLDGDNSDLPNESLHTDSGDEDVIVINSVINLYENEPLENPDQEINMSVQDDEDGIDPRTCRSKLEAIFEGLVTLYHWLVLMRYGSLTARTKVSFKALSNLCIVLYILYRCTCSLFRKELLVNAKEYRCCREVGSALHQLMFDFSIEKISCVTQHEDYIAMTHPTVLKNVGPLLKNKDGRSYRSCTGHHENE